MRTLGEILYSPSQYVIPVFQRNYRWEAEQWEKLWTGLVEIQRPDKKGNHFMGFLVFVPGLAQPGQHTAFHLIDGQQRLTTSSLVLVALRNVARERGEGDLADEINENYLVHSRKKGDQRLRLLPKEQDHDSYASVISGEGHPTGRVAEALGYFEDCLRDAGVDKPGYLRSIVDTVCQRLEFMCATLEAENAYNIFKSLNSTGVPLGASDLIRNFVFMHVPPDDQDEFDKAHWRPLEGRFLGPAGKLDEKLFSEFFRDYLMSFGHYISPKDTFEEFEGRYEATEFRPKALAKDLDEAAGDYEIISGHRADSDEQLTEALQRLNDLESSTTYPLLLSLFRNRRQALTDSAGLARSVDMLRGFILRRFVCGLSSRGYGEMFLRAIDARGPEGLESYLLDRDWPDDRRFEEAFVVLPLYQRSYKREILEALERAREHKEPARLDAAQIEHVLPQTLSEQWRADLGPDAERIHATWLHRPGNLTLSGYNQELWNHPYAFKRSRYADSNIVLTREIAGWGKWGEDEIKARGSALARDASRAWPGPKEALVRSKPLAPKVEVREDRFALRERFWSGLSLHLSATHPELPMVEAKATYWIRLPSEVTHVGFELKFVPLKSCARIEVWFWREASFPMWEEIQREPQEFERLLQSTLVFESWPEISRGLMSAVSASTNLRDESTWPDVYRWIGPRLAALYREGAPLLRHRLAERGFPSQRQGDDQEP